MLREAPVAGRSRATIRAGRRWHRVAAAALPQPPARVEVIAAVSLHRQPLRPKKGMWDDRIETACHVLGVALWKLGRSQQTGAFATTSRQLVWALGKTSMRSTWGAPPAQMDGPDADKYWKQHRRSLSRWLDALEGAGVISCGGQRDNQGYWWRLRVELLAVDVDERLRDRMDRARVRERGWQRRRRRSRARGVKRDLQTIRDAGAPLTKAQQRSAAIQRRRAISASRRRPSHKQELLAYPFGDLQSFGLSGGALWDQQAQCDYPAKRRGAHARSEVPSLRSRFEDTTHLDPSAGDRTTLSASAREGTEGGEGLPGGLLGGHGMLGASFGALAGAWRRTDGLGGRIGLAVAHIARMAPTHAELNDVVLRAAVQAWWLAVRGMAAESPAVIDAVADCAELLPELRRAAARYEEDVEHRPPGWPRSGAAALLLLAASHDAPLSSLQLIERRRELAEHMRTDRLLGGRAVTSLSDPYAEPRVPAGYESRRIMRRRLAEQLQAAGDSLDRYPTLRAAEAAALQHERTGRLPVTQWPSPSTQLAWRQEHYPLPLAEPQDAPTAAANPLTDPQRYADAAAAVRAAGPGTHLTGELAEHLLHAWHAERYTLAGAIARWQWRPRAKLARISAAVEAYEQHADVRPAGWPQSGLHALMVLATWRDPGSTRLDGTPVHMARPDTLPGAVERLATIAAQMRRHATRTQHIERSGKRARRRIARQHAERNRNANATPKLRFRTSDADPAGLPHPASETPDLLRRRIADQLAAAGDHAANHPSLEDAELALLEHEEAGRLPSDCGPSPTAMRQARHHHETQLGPQAIATADWQHLLDLAASSLPERSRELLDRLSPISTTHGTLVIAATANDLGAVRQQRLHALLSQLAQTAGLALTAAFIDAVSAPAFTPQPTELTGPADMTAATGDRYADERITRYAIS